MRLAAAAALLAAAAGPAEAGAWTRARGETQVILKYEAMRAGTGFDQNGETAPLPGPRRDRALGVFAEYGLTDRLTVQVKGDWQSGSDAIVDYEGRGPAEIGLTWQAWRSRDTAVSLYGGYADGGEGRNAGYAPPGVGEQDWELRGSVGRSFGVTVAGAALRGFAEIQAARRMRDGLPDETRADVTLGGHLGDDWMVLVQGYGGAADDAGARWLAVETTAVRRLGDWSLQAGWRRTVAGRETPLADGPVVAVWRRF